MHALELPPVSAWTGRVAAWAPFSTAADAQQQQAGGLPPLKTSSTGVWLKSDAGGVLALQWRPAAPPLLTCTLRASPQPLVRAPLAPGSFAFRLLCPQHGAPPHGDASAGMAAAGGGSGHLLFLTLALPCGEGAAAGSGSSASRRPTQQREGEGGSYTLAVHFDTAQAGRECGALLQAIHQGSLQAVQARPPPQLQPPPPQPAPAPAPAVTAASGAEAYTAGAQQTAQAVAGVAPEGAAAEAAGGDPALFGFADEASLEAAIEASSEVGQGRRFAGRHAKRAAGRPQPPVRSQPRCCCACVQWRGAARGRLPGESTASAPCPPAGGAG